MAILRYITQPGNYGNLQLVGNNPNEDIGLHVHVPEGHEVRFGAIDISNLFLPLVKTGHGRLVWDSLYGSAFGGDLMNLRAGNILGYETIVRNNTPTRPYSVCVRRGRSESVAQCLKRHGEVVHDSRLLSFITHPRFPGQEILAGYHVDGVAQIYATMGNGYTLNPNGVISNIELPYIDAVLCGAKTQGFMGSEINRYTNFRLGEHLYRIITDGYHYHTTFNQLDNSIIGGSNVDVNPNNLPRISHAKDTRFISTNNQFIGF